MASGPPCAEAALCIRRKCRAAVRISVTEANVTLPLVLDYGDPRAAARALLEYLPRPSIRAC